MKVKKDPKAFKVRPPRDGIHWGSKREERFSIWNRLRSGDWVSLPKSVISQLSGVILEEEYEVEVVPTSKVENTLSEEVG